MKLKTNQIKSQLQSGEINLYKQAEFNIPLVLNCQDRLKELLVGEPENLSIMMIKPYDVANFDYVLEEIRKSGGISLYVRTANLSQEDVKFLYPDKQNDSYYGILEQGLIQNKSIFIVVKARQVDLNTLKAGIETGTKTDGRIRKYLRGAKIHPVIMQKMKEKIKNPSIQNGLDDENYTLLMRHIVHGNGIHTADTNQEAVEIIKKLIL